MSSPVCVLTASSGVLRLKPPVAGKTQSPFVNHRPGLVNRKLESSFNVNRIFGESYSNASCIFPALRQQRWYISTLFDSDLLKLSPHHHRLLLLVHATAPDINMVPLRQTARVAPVWSPYPIPKQATTSPESTSTDASTSTPTPTPEPAPVATATAITISGGVSTGTSTSTSRNSNSGNGSPPRAGLRQVSSSHPRGLTWPRTILLRPVHPGQGTTRI
jgi:hypothetical protein